MTAARIAALLLLPLMCTQAQKGLDADSFTQTGVASFYAEDFHGKKTANGETYSMWGMTAAHQTLPFNTLVKVTNLDNGKSVVVRINDAGPFKDNRIIDLTRKAAAKIDMIETGTAKVRLEVVGRDESRGVTNVSDNEYYRLAVKKIRLSGFGIQVGSFSDMDNLIRRLDALDKAGVEGVSIQLAEERGETLHRIVLGNFTTRDAAEDRLRDMKKAGISGFVFKIR